MINKKNVLGKTPQELGDKDAIHVAIVSVRAGSVIEPGGRCKMNEFHEAIPANYKDSVGVADPFRKGNITTGQAFWLLLEQDAVPNVQHVWEHPEVDFSPPTREVKLNEYLQRNAVGLGVTYQELMDMCQYVVDNDKPAPIPETCTKTSEQIQEAIDESDIELYDIWSCWADETGYVFTNNGTECCPEYDYPDELFELP